jgi:hypothetical protein
LAEVSEGASGISWARDREDAAAARLAKASQNRNDDMKSSSGECGRFVAKQEFIGKERRAEV